MIVNFDGNREYVESDARRLVRYLQVPVDDSIKFTFAFMYNGDWSNQKFDINNINAEFKFYAEENPEKVFTASKVDSVYTNCSIDEDSATIRVPIISNSLGLGKLLCKLVITYPDSDTESGYSVVNRIADPMVAMVDYLEHGRSMVDASEPDNFNIVVRMPYDNKTKILPKYSVDIRSTENGTITTDATEYETGKMVWIKTVPDSGYELDYIMVRSNYSRISTTDEGNGYYSFIMPNSDVIIDGAFKEISVVNYKVVVAATTGGTITTDKSFFNAGEIVYLYISADQGKELTDITAQYLEGYATISKINNNKYSFIMPDGNTLVTGTFSNIVRSGFSESFNESFG